MGNTQGFSYRHFQKCVGLRSLGSVTGIAESTYVGKIKYMLFRTDCSPYFALGSGWEVAVSPNDRVRVIRRPAEELARDHFPREDVKIVRVDVFEVRGQRYFPSIRFPFNHLAAKEII